jgi:serine/threonine protein kinase
MPAPGDILVERYRIDARLGAGGMATVHRAHDLRLGRDVAIKILLPNLAGDPLVAERFDREARALASIRHPNVVQVHDVEPGDPETGREPFFVMELCEGGSLADRLAAAGGALPPDELVPMVVGVATGLAELHGQGIVHRDIKPHNILLGPGGAKLGDFGVARTDTPDTTTLTAAGSTVGTLAYLPPEQLAGEPATPTSDVYSLGVVTYQALTGQLPRPASSWAQLVEMRNAPVPPPSAVRPELGTAFDEPLGAALTGDPGARPTALAFGSSLAGALGRWSRRPRQNVGAQPATPPPAISPPALPPPDVGEDSPTVVSVPFDRPPAPSPSSRSNRGLPALLVAAAGLLGVLLVLAAISGRPSDVTTASPSAPAGAAASPSPSPSASPSPPPSPNPVPTAAPDPLVSALANMRSAIDQAEGGRDGLKGKDAKELRDRLEQVEQKLNEGNLDGAAQEADGIVDKVEEFGEEGDLGRDEAATLLAAAKILRAAIPGD